MGCGDDVDRGTPGGSLLRTYEQRRAGREARIRKRHPHVGGLLLALTDEPASTYNFQRGALAEIEVAERLQRRCGPDVHMLFNRRMGARRRDGDIDVLAVTPNGVHVVDVKRYANAAVRVRITGGLLRRLTQQLFIRGRDRTDLLESLARQRDAVRPLIDAVPGGAAVPLHLALCFVDADLPMATQTINGVAVLGSRQVARRFSKPGTVNAETRTVLLRHLAAHLPPA